MGPFYISLCTILLCASSIAVDVPFNQNYMPQWGGDHVTILDQGRQVQIKIDPQSGGGFRSNFAYGSGYFRMRVKVPQNANGIATTFYLSSIQESVANNVAQVGNHDELDFELLGNNGPPYTLNTNIFTQDTGHREQRINLWFDSTLDFHEYELLWNQHQIVFSIDKTPIRIFKNNIKVGVRYPKLPMYIHASLWNASQWLGPTNWSKGPFFANYQEFEILGCPYDNSNPSKCESPKYSWNAPKTWQLDPQQQKLYENIKKKYMTFDYCKSSSVKIFPECGIST